VSENPEKSLHTPLAHKISQFAINKYMRQFFKPKAATSNQQSNEEHKTSHSVKQDSAQAEKVISLSQKVEK
jgi:hypothetical protein